MRRGDIYFIKRRNELSFGSEIKKARPAVIVSNNALNNTSEVIEVVYLTAHPKKDMPVHVAINATGIPSVALCEQIDHVSKKLVGDWCGRCTDAEMDAIDRALMSSLGLVAPKVQEVEESSTLSDGEQWWIDKLGEMEAERDRYAKMVDALLAVIEI